MKLIIDINDNEYMGIKEYPNNITSYPVTIHIYDAIRKGIPLEKEPCEDEEYEKDLNGLKEQILKEGNTLISKQDLLERFVEIDNEYKNSHWNLLQILANIDILIGKEPIYMRGYYMRGYEDGKSDVLDKIREEVGEEICLTDNLYTKETTYTIEHSRLLEILDYIGKSESESKDDTRTANRDSRKVE